eukprot:jgi/Bigna1/136062/aug1.32_g10770
MSKNQPASPKAMSFWKSLEKKARNEAKGRTSGSKPRSRKGTRSRGNLKVDTNLNDKNKSQSISEETSDPNIETSSIGSGSPGPYDQLNRRDFVTTPGEITSAEGKLSQQMKVGKEQKPLAPDGIDKDVQELIHSMLNEQVAMANAKASIGDLTGVDELNQADAKTFQENNEVLLEKLWDIFDTDKNGALSPLENKRLMKAYFTAQLEFQKKVIKDSFINGFRSGLPASIPHAKFVPMITKAADKIEALVEQAFREKMTEQNYERLHLIIENEDGKVRKTDFLEKFYKAQKDFIDEDEISEQMIKELIPPLQEDILAVVQAELNQKSKNSERNSSGNLIAETTTAQQEDAGFMDVDIDKS